jgi:hypothetical protein
MLRSKKHRVEVLGRGAITPENCHWPSLTRQVAAAARPERGAIASPE